MLIFPFLELDIQYSLANCQRTQFLNLIQFQAIGLLGYHIEPIKDVVLDV